MTETSLPSAELADDIYKSLTPAQKSLLQRIDLSTGNDALLQIESQEDSIVAHELLNLGLIAHIIAIYVFVQLTSLGLELRNRLDG